PAYSGQARREVRDQQGWWLSLGVPVWRIRTGYCPAARGGSGGGRGHLQRWHPDSEGADARREGGNPPGYPGYDQHIARGLIRFVGPPVRGGPTLFGRWWRGTWSLSRHNVTLARAEGE